MDNLRGVSKNSILAAPREPAADANSQKQDVSGQPRNTQNLHGFEENFVTVFPGNWISNNTFDHSFFAVKKIMENGGLRIFSVRRKQIPKPARDTGKISFKIFGDIDKRRASFTADIISKRP